MMKRTFSGGVAVVAILFGLAGATSVSAQTMSGFDAPAEFPPASYTGRQYVDSQGCIFLRAGFDDAVTWIPRVSSKRQKMCGFTPTDAGGTAASTAPVVADAAPTVVQPRRVATAAPVRGAAPVAPAPRRAPVYRPRAAPGTFYGGSGLVLTSGHAILPGQVLTAPPAPRAITVPPGYRPAWEDDRLNPNRGKQLLSGALQTALIWTQTVPRRLVDPTSGKDVTRDYNYLVYPYTDYAKQKRDLAGGQHIVVRLGSGQSMIVLKSQLGTNASGQTVLRAPVTPLFSSKSMQPRGVAPQPRRAPTAPGSGRFVQVGSFGVPANAQATVARLQRAGLPVRIGTVNRGGRNLQVVMAGPFADPGQAASGLSLVRRAGFADAFLRN